jgi:hypothetical protein
VGQSSLAETSRRGDAITGQSEVLILGLLERAELSFFPLLKVGIEAITKITTNNTTWSAQN